MYYLNTFILYSVLGHILETVFFMIIKVNKKSGFMFLWWTPLYGIGAVMSLIIYKLVSKKIKNKLWKNVILLLLYFISFTLLEMAGGILIEKIFGYEMWNYSDAFWHFGKYASAPTSFLWAILALCYVYVFKRFTDWIINKIPKFFSILLGIVFIIDFICSILKIGH